MSDVPAIYKTYLKIIAHTNGNRALDTRIDWDRMTRLTVCDFWPYPDRCYPMSDGIGYVLQK